MDGQAFTPSEQLLGKHQTPRQPGRSNYQGDQTLPVNQGTHVPDELNTNLWITGLPGWVTIPILLAHITNTGRVRSTVVNPPTDDHPTASASVSFFRREDAEVLYHAGQQRGFIIGGRVARISWNRNKVAESDSSRNLSRVLLVAGDPEIVNRQALERYFSNHFVYDLDQVIDHGIVSTESGSIARLEYRFGSWRSQASFANQALTREFSDVLMVAYGDDPCARISPYHEDRNE
ncbi:hypothetical protein F4779DRAFT_627395 [Xylariaceae sp. FL0662B]|nr:hypothetical protein F4779DRAFT_627395 [Xylariaceae sp. FL0662B]